MTFILVAVTLAVYFQVADHQFIEFDDQTYIFDNPHVSTGLNWENFLWAFSSAYAANWHPLTWLSHMVDVQIFGLQPGGHHLVNVVLHAANTALLFLLLCRLGGTSWRAAVVAALFALHPLHVESVAWVAERKDVLSTLFWMLTLLCYTRYVNTGKTGHYLLTVATFVLGLMSKSMLVTLPLVMLLLDYWPLRRFGGADGEGRTAIRRLILEKTPFLLLSAISCLLTYDAQQTGASVTSLADSPLMERLSNALVSYAAYLIKMVWPAKLAVFYPYDPALPLWQTIGAMLLLSAVTILVLWQRKSRPHLLVGWFWYIITLLPVIGIVRIGLHSLADRYTYIPLTGVFVMVVWTVAECTERWKCRSALLTGLTMAVLAVCFATTWRQVSHWRDTTTLFTHTLKVTDDNYMALCVLGQKQEREGKLKEALESITRALEIAPWYENARVHQGMILANQGFVDAAIHKYSEAIVQDSTSVSGRINLGILLAQQGRLDEAANNFKVAADIDPRSVAAHYNLAMTLSKQGRLEEAVGHYRKAVRLDPYDVQCRNNLGIALAEQGHLDEAILQFSAALKRKPDFFDARNNLELARAKQKALLKQP